MIPDPGAVERCLSELEMLANRSGWDNQTSMCYFLYSVQGGQRIGVGLPMPTPGNREPGAALADLAVGMALDPIAFPPITPMKARRLAGLALVQEVWINTDPQVYAKNPGRRLADIPGSYEARLVVAVDTADRLYWRERKRGQRPHGGIVGEQAEPPADGELPTPTSIGGRVPAALRLIVACACEKFLEPADYAIADDLEAHKKALVAELMGEESQ